MAGYRILLHPAALLELRSLDGSVRAVVAKQIAKLAKYPFLGDPLGNKHGYDLTGYRNMYADRKRNGRSNHRSNRSSAGSIGRRCMPAFIY
jgi:hypothetical protein